MIDPCIIGNPTNRRLANTSRRCIDHTHQRHLITWINKYLQVTKHIANFFPAIKFNPANDLVRQLVLNKCLFQNPAHRINPIKNSGITKLTALINKLIDLLGNCHRLGCLIFISIDTNLFPCISGWYQQLGFSFAVVGNKLIRYFQNVRRTAKILLQFYHFRLGPIFFKNKNISDISPSPAIYRLIRIAGNTNIAMRQSYIFSYLILGTIGILILIHKQIFKTLTKLVTNLFVVSQHQSCSHQQIIKIQSIIFSEYRLISSIDFG